MANIHYFQRYHGKENVHTANALLLINRLYQYKPLYFYKFLESIVEDKQSEYDFRVNMTLQTKSDSKKNSSVPDAMILQYGYRLCIETKIGDWFYIDQIKGHIESFNKIDTKYKIFISLSNVNNCSISHKIEELVADFNNTHELFDENRLIYKHLTFEKLIDIIEEILSDRDFEFLDVINDYKDYCYEQELIDVKYQIMKAYAAGDTLEINKKLNLYYRKSRDTVRANMIGLYKDKKIVAIGKINKVVNAYMPEEKLIISGNDVSVTDNEKVRIKEAIIDSVSYGYDLKRIEHSFYLVDKFEDCEFAKVSKGGLYGGKIFELESDYGICDIKNKSVKRICDELSKKTWS